MTSQLYQHQPKPKLIVLDDDPTGSQTVHGCLLLMRWDLDTLRAGLKDESPLFFVLTNTRALTPDEARSTMREVCQNLKQALAAENIQNYLLVSRSDSTLRGHYPIETDVIAQELGSDRGFDAHFLVPAFFEGGRLTRDSVHYVMLDGKPVPAHETEFAKDSVFAYRHSYLPDYVAEKTQGRIPADAVLRFTLQDLRSGTLTQLRQLQHNQCVVVDAEQQSDLDQFAQDLWQAVGEGKRFLFRSAASLLTSLANLPPQPIAPAQMASYVREGRPGAVIVGSHVKKTTEQLAALLETAGTVPIEINVAHLLEESEVERSHLLQQILDQAQQAHTQGKTPVVFTSRQELTFPDAQTRLNFGTAVSQLLMDVERGLPATIGFLISKGGITSNDTLSTGLNLTTARLLGQILPGVSVVRTPATHPQFPNLPVVLFPGNVGDRSSLAAAFQRLHAAT